MKAGLPGVKAVIKILPHLTIILAGMLIVFYVLDRFNPSMGYLDNPAQRLLLLALAVTSIANAIILIAYQRRA